VSQRNSGAPAGAGTYSETGSTEDHYMSASHIARVTATTRRQAGMTLIELLVVITIIAVLVAIIMPTIANTRQAAYKTSAIKQLQSLSQASMLYIADFDTFIVPSTNYGIPEDEDNRMWTQSLFTYAGNTKQPFIAKGSNGQYPGSWKLRGWGTFGMNSATALDEDNGCDEKQDDKSGCSAFNEATIVDKTLNPSAIPLFTSTPSGDTAKNYRGWEFNPYNGLPRQDDVMQSPPLVSDRDLVQELVVLPGDYIKAVYARYNSTGHDEGFAPIVFADGHAKVFSAKQIAYGRTGILWRFR